MEPIANSETLWLKVLRDMAFSDKPRVVFQAGSLHLDYMLDRLSREEHEDLIGAGMFARYSMGQATSLAKTACELGKEVEFTFVIDDQGMKQESSSHDPHRVRNAFYKGHSGANAELWGFHRYTLTQEGFAEKDVIRHDHGKPGRRDCLYFSELVLRAQGDQTIENGCARAYVKYAGLVTDDKTHLVSFVPAACRHAVADIALDQHLRGISASHVFLNTETREHRGVKVPSGFFLGPDVGYRKD